MQWYWQQYNLLKKTQFGCVAHAPKAVKSLDTVVSATLTALYENEAKQVGMIMS